MCTSATKNMVIYFCFILDKQWDFSNLAKLIFLSNFTSAIFLKIPAKILFTYYVKNTIEK